MSSTDDTTDGDVTEPGDDLPEPKEGADYRVSDGLGEHEGTAERIGAGAAREVERSAVNGLKRPKTLAVRFWKGVIRAGYKGLYKASNADGIIHSYAGDQVNIEPAQYHASADEDGNPLWITPGEADEWVPSGGRDTALGPGNVPMLLASGDYYSLNSELQARVDRALSMGHDQPLYRNPTVNLIEVEYEEVKNGELATDGGNMGREISITDERLEDHLIDLTGTNDMILSWEGYKETHPEKMGSEEHENAEFRGRMMEKDQDYGRLAMKLMIIAGLIVVGALAAVFVLPQLLGGGGGGGGSVVPGGILSLAFGMV